MNEVTFAKKRQPASANREANVALAYKFLKDGKSIKWIEDFFAEHQQLKPITVRLYLMDARKLIGTETEMDVDFASMLHDSRYEKIWEDEKDIYLNWHFAPEEPWERAENMDIVRRYSDLLKALKQRENMYGLREKDLMLALHSNISLTRDYKADSFEHFLKKEFDLSKLSLEDRVELLQLLQESYDGDLFKEKDYVVEDDEDVKETRVLKIDNKKSKEVIVEGVNEIKPEKPKPKKIIIRKTSSVVVKDLVDKQGKTPEEIGNKLEETQNKLVAKKFKKK